MGRCRATDLLICAKKLIYRANRQKPRRGPPGHPFPSWASALRKFRRCPPLARLRGLFLRLVQLLLYLAVTLVGRADALQVELKALVDQVVAKDLNFLLIYRSGNGRGRIGWPARSGILNIWLGCVSNGDRAAGGAMAWPGLVGGANGAGVGAT